MDLDKQNIISNVISTTATLDNKDIEEIQKDSAKEKVDISSSDSNYKVYTNDELGISFEYPAIWKVTEKSDRFATQPDVIVGTVVDMPSFKFINSKSQLDKSLNVLDLKDVVDMGVSQFTSKPGNRLIEDVDMNKYSIDGKKTGTFLITTEWLPNIEAAQQIFMVENDNKIYTLAYSDITSKFDSPESQDRMNHIINSFKFINSDNHDKNNEDDGDNN